MMVLFFNIVALYIILLSITVVRSSVDVVRIYLSADSGPGPILAKSMMVIVMTVLYLNIVSTYIILLCTTNCYVNRLLLSRHEWIMSRYTWV